MHTQNGSPLVYMTRGRLPQRAGSLCLNGGGAATAVPPYTCDDLCNCATGVTRESRWMWAGDNVICPLDQLPEPPKFTTCCHAVPMSIVESQRPSTVPKRTSAVASRSPDQYVSDTTSLSLTLFTYSPVSGDILHIILNQGSVVWHLSWEIGRRPMEKAKGELISWLCHCKTTFTLIRVRVPSPGFGLRLVQNLYQCERAPLEYMRSRVYWNPYTATRTRINVNAP